MLTAMTRDLERGATAVEYGIMVGFVAAVIVFAVSALGDATIGLFEPTTTYLKTLTTP